MQQDRRSGIVHDLRERSRCKTGAGLRQTDFPKAQLDETFVNSGAANKDVRVCSATIFSARSSHEKELDVSRSSVIRTRALNDRPD